MHAVNLAIVFSMCMLPNSNPLGMTSEFGLIQSMLKTMITRSDRIFVTEIFPGVIVPFKNNDEGEITSEQERINGMVKNLDLKERSLSSATEVSENEGQEDAIKGATPKRVEDEIDDASDPTEIDVRSLNAPRVRSRTVHSFDSNSQSDSNTKRDSSQEVSVF